MATNRHRHVLLTAAILALMPLSLMAQRTTRLVFVSATDDKGAPVTNLTRADLQVTENGSPREVTANPAVIAAYLGTRAAKAAAGHTPIELMGGPAT